jgi:hypothetical protein
VSRSSSWRSLALALVALLGLAVAAPSAAQAQETTYLDIADGLPPRQGLGVATQTPRPVSFLVYRGSLVVARGYSRKGRSFVAFNPQPGDVFLVSGRDNAPLPAFTWDGSPVYDGLPCAGARTFTGRRTGQGVSLAAAGTFVAGPGRYAPRNEERGIVTVPSPTTFAVELAAPLRAGQMTFASATQTLPGLFIRTTVEAPVGAPCPDVTPPVARLLRVRAIVLRSLLARGLPVGTSVSEPALVEHRVYALRSSRRARGAQARRTLVGVRRVQARRAGTVRTNVRLTARGKRTVRRLARPRLQVVTRVRDAAGNRRTLPARRVTVRR